MSLRFLRYARPAVAAAISQRASDAQARIRATIVPQLQMRTDLENGAAAAWPAPAPGATLSVLGPADVVALAADQILARVPAPDAGGVSPSQFAWVEFVRADLPWLFTPYAPNADDTLMPWLCLVVVPAADARITQGPHGAVLSVASTHLPDLARAAEWAHVQEGGARSEHDNDPAAVGEGLRQEPRRFRSRLLCPTVLRSQTDYLACLVPTLLGGQKAGLGKDFDLNSQDLRGPAWTAGQAVELPVYDHWHFATGASDRFSDLAMELQHYDPSTTAARTLEAGAPDGPRGPQFANARLPLEAAMRPSIVPPPPPPPPPPAALTAHLTTRLSDASPLAPPTYGSRHVRAALPFAPQAPAWVRTLNLDPVRRVAAGLGAEVVRRHQEEMMAAIWEQAGEIERANQLLRIGQTARAAATALFQRRVLPDLLDARDGRHLGVLLWLSPMLGHLPVPPGGLTVRTELERSCLPRLATSGAYRKFARPNGPPMRRLRRHRDGMSSASELLLRLADGGGQRTPPPAPEATAITSDELASLGQLPGPFIDPRFPGPHIDPLPGGPPWRTPPAEPESLERARTLAGYLAFPRGGACRPLGAAGGSERETLFEGLRAAADPAMTIPRRSRARIGTETATLARIGATDDALDPIMLAPKLPWAMSRPLMAMARDWMAPALEARDAPENYIAVLEPNRTFIESYMAGLNEEIGREMLWRGFPTDQRGTVFDRFWTDTRAEWPDLHTWSAALGDHGLPGTVPKMVIAVRGRLLQRFDRARVFLQKASTATPPAPLPDLGNAQSTLYPLIETRLPGGVACFGFDLTTAQAIGGAGAGPGWYLVFQEPPTDLRFGPPATAAAGSHVAGSATSATADTFAENARRQQQRVYIHAATLLGRN